MKLDWDQLKCLQVDGSPLISLRSIRRVDDSLLHGVRMIVTCFQLSSLPRGDKKQVLSESCKILCTRLSEKCLSFTDTSFTNMKPNPGPARSLKPSPAF